MTRLPKTCVGVALVLGLPLVLGCSPGDSRPARSSPSPTTRSGGTQLPPCQEGAFKDCFVTLGVHGGVTTCYSGTRTCVDGAWGPCLGEVVTTESVASRAGTGPLALSVPTPCATNPCDPTCHNYLELPDRALEAEVIETDTDVPTDFEWSEGSSLRALADAPVSPCFSGEQCPSGQTCAGVATAPGCEHDKCREGTALTAGCDPCVQAVCRADASCCRGPCGPGELLGPEGDRCYFVEPTDGLAWGTAERACESRGAGWGLITVDSDLDNRFIGALSDAEVWVGLNDHANSGAWSWSSGEPVTQVWGLPAPVATTGGSCVAVHAYAEVPEWYPEACEQKNGYVCEGPAAPPLGCEHEPCVEGDALDATCDSCVGQICTENPSCCTEGWDAECVAMVSSVCQDACGCPAGSVDQGGRCYSFSETSMSYTMARASCQAMGPGWDLAVVATVEQEQWLASQVSTGTWLGLDDRETEGELRWVDGTVLSAATPSGGWRGSNNADWNDCVQLSAGGAWEVQDCDVAARPACEGPRSIARYWDASCVDRVEALCGATCEAASSESGCGVGTWPGETEPMCAGYDLRLGIPCEATLPVCNFGASEAPSGIQVVHFDPASVDASTCSPDTASGTVCTTSASIPPGRCVSITDCDGLNTSRRVMVNPPGAAHVDECRCLDNWGLYEPDVACQAAPTCFAASSGTTPDPTRSHVFFLVERSPAMGSDSYLGWHQMRSALRAFARSADAAGVDVSLEFFPLDDYGANRDGCYSDGDCSEAVLTCGNPAVLPGRLSSEGTLTDAQEALVLEALSNTSPGAAAPTSAALEAALSAMRDAKMRQPAGTYAVVFVGTGIPGACEMDPTFLVSLAEYFHRTWGILTYTVATSGADSAVMDAVALTGGTGEALDLSGWDNSGLGQSLLETVVGDTGARAACTTVLGNLANIDPDQAEVHYLHGDGTDEALARVSDAQDCVGAQGGAWYYDSPTSPTAVELCPLTCDAVQADVGAEIHVGLGCRGGPAQALRATTFTETYRGDCPQLSQQPQWGFLSYSASTPSDSEIGLQVRAAPSLGDLATAEWLPLGEVREGLQNEICLFASGCYLDVWEALKGVPAAHQPYLEVRITLRPSTDNQSPLLNHWQLTYSCPDAE